MIEFDSLSDSASVPRQISREENEAKVMNALRGELGIVPLNVRFPFWELIEKQRTGPISFSERDLLNRLHWEASAGLC